MGVRSSGILAFLALASCEPALADAAGIETDYRLAAERVQKHADNFWLDGNREGERALNRSWTLLAEWTAAYLNEHPGATAKRLKRAAPGGDLSVLPLGPQTILVSAEVGSAFGTIFIVDGTSGPFRPVWSIQRRAGREAFPLLDAWTAKAAAGNCRDTVEDSGWARCGSIGGTAKRLSDDAQGRPRFLVEAGYSEAAGNTELQQLSFWTWTGTTAEPEFVTTVGVNIDDEGIRFDGNLLNVRVAEDYRMIAPWWDHLERQLDWVFRVGPERIEDLGKTPVVPELDVVDEVLFRAAHHLPVDDLATPQVLAMAEKIVHESSAGRQDGQLSLAMAGSPMVRHQDGQALVCLPAEEPGILTFTLSGSFVSDISVTPHESGDGCAHGKP